MPNQKNQKQRGGWAPVSAGTGAGSGTSGEFGYEPTRGAPLSSPFKVRSRKMRGGAIGDGTGAGAGASGANLTGFNALPKGAAISGVVNSQAAMFGRIPLTITEQGMNFSSRTAAFHRSRKNRSRRQRGGALMGAPALMGASVESLGEKLPPSMTGAMTTDGTGGSATGRLDAMLVETHAFPKQTGGGSRRRNRNRQNRNRSRKQTRNRNRNRQQQNRNRQQQNRRRTRKQRGGSSLGLGYGPAVPPSGDYTMGVDLQKAGLNPQWFDEGKVNNQFPMSVPGGKLN
jgi:hypothetical protein